MMNCTKGCSFALKLMASMLALYGAANAAHAQQGDVKQLGVTLTPSGAEVAGNADGTIPAYTGGLTTPPANYNKANPGWRPDPFPNDKPLFKIDASNMEKYKDKLSAGTMEMMKKYPTFNLEVFQTRRTTAHPKHVLDNTIKNATRCKIINDGLGLDTSTGCGHGYAFPIPKNGLEAMWTHHTRYQHPAQIYVNATGLYVKPSGEVVRTYQGLGYRGWDFHDPQQSKPDRFYTIRYEYKAPTRMANTIAQQYDEIVNSEKTAHTYSPATRRVRLSPDNSADTPVAAMGGAMVYDEDQIFAGKLDRYDWKLMGKKEMYIPYNNYRIQYPDPKDADCSGDKRFTPYHLNTKCVRWELHRVWHVRATLKDGKRHIYKTRDMYFDEDGWSDGLADNFDQNGSLYKVNQMIGSPLYDVAAPSVVNNLIIDMVAGTYGYSGMLDGAILPIDPWPRVRFSPDTVSIPLIKP